jgi:hypothetical protein
LRAREGTLSGGRKKEEESELVPSVERGRYLKLKRRRAAIVTGVASVSAPAFNGVALRTVCHAPVIQTVKQTVQLLSKMYIET